MLREFPGAAPGVSAKAINATRRCKYCHFRFDSNNTYSIYIYIP